MAREGDIQMVELSCDTQRRMTWKITQKELNPRTIVYTPEREFRSRMYEVWECVCLDQPELGQLAATPIGMALDSIENNTTYDQGRLIYMHRETFSEPNFGPWGGSVTASIVAADGDCLLVDAGSAHRGRWFYDIEQASDSFDYEYTPVWQTSFRPYQTWECRVLDDVAAGQVAGTPTGLFLVHWENTVEYDQGERVWVHRDTFEAGWSDWYPEIER